MAWTKYANTDLAVTAWLAGLPGLNSGMVATTLPEDNTSWAASGFVAARTVGGTPEMYVPLRQPVVSVDCYAVPPAGGNKPQWGQANNLAETIVSACYSTSNFGATLAGPAGYPHMRMLQAHPLQEPRRVYGDRSFYARYSFDLQVYWIPLP
jgi:hypothetical protein